MFAPQSDDDYDKIMLSFKERHILRHLLKQQESPASFCTPKQIAVFEKYGLIYVCRDQKVSLGYGIEGIVQGEPQTITATDKAFRYFLYRKEDYFKGKLPVVIALVALIISIFSLALQFFS